MSTIHALPLMTATAYVTPEEDLFFGIGFTTAGAPLDLDDIAFTLKIGSLATFISDQSPLRVAGGNLFCFMSAADKAGWPSSGDFDMDLLADDGVYRRSMFFRSRLRIQPASAPFSLAATFGAARAKGLSPLQVDAILAMLGPPTGPTEPLLKEPVPVTADITASASEIYEIDAPGVTFTLPTSWIPNGGPVIVVDNSGAGATVTGPVRNWPVSVTSQILGPNASMTFVWSNRHNGWISIQ